MEQEAVEREREGVEREMREERAGIDRARHRVRVAMVFCKTLRYRGIGSDLFVSRGGRLNTGTLF